ncbi:MAG: DUF1573 domain-containing protein [Bernardetiaceae bacterium]|nr:DUF1573 domain-containing protein [Bernardetiaceae bacterium]
MNKYVKIMAAFACATIFVACDSGSESNEKKEVEVNAAEGLSTENPVEAVSQPATEAESANSNTPALAIMEIEEKEFEFGKIKEGESVSHVFKFTNTGEAPLTITNTHTTCGCTVPAYSKDPVMPGEQGEVSVKFDSKGKVGTQRKTVTVNANIEGGSQTFVLKGEVVKDELSKGPYRQ